MSGAKATESTKIEWSLQLLKGSADFLLFPFFVGSRQPVEIDQHIHSLNLH